MAVLTCKLLLEYDGAHFLGWQSQKQGRTVQDALEEALACVTGEERVVVVGAGRTDTGVHARSQAAHVKLDTALSTDRLRWAINSQLPEDVRVQSVEIVPGDFHARFSAVRRHYSYTIVTREIVIGRHYVWFPKKVIRNGLDTQTLAQCAESILGRHDFTGFAKANPEVDSTICQVDTSHWESTEARHCYHIAANRFLHHMVRFLVGTMVEVARGRYTAGQFAAQLHEGGGVLTVYRAPAAGLILEEVQYPESEEGRSDV